MKYPIKKEFYPYAYFTPPIPSARIAGGLGAMLRPPRSLFRDPSLTVERRRIFSVDGEEIELLLISPKDVKGKTGALVYYHGGGFLFGATWYHYRIAARYAKEIPLRVIFVQYRLAPKHLHPLPAEDCYAALRWTYENAEELSVDRERIAVAGDSAGGALTAAVCQMARDRGADLPRAQMMIYPVTAELFGYPHLERSPVPQDVARVSGGRGDPGCCLCVSHGGRLPCRTTEGIC